MRRPLRTALVGLGVLLAGIFVTGIGAFLWTHRDPGVTFREIASERGTLMDTFLSYSSPDEIRRQVSSRQLLSKGGEWTIVESFKREERGRPYEMLRTRIANYSHLGFTGDIEFRFFNNRLMDVTFWPTDVEAYVGALRMRKNIVLAPTRTGSFVAAVGSNVELSVLSRDSRAVGVRWSDVRLNREEHLWIERFA